MKKTGEQWMVQKTPAFLAGLGSELVSPQLGTHPFSRYNYVPLCSAFPAVREFPPTAKKWLGYVS